MRSPELERRHHASAIVSSMMLDCLLSLVKGYGRGDTNVGKVFPEWMCAMAIRENDDAGRPPINASQIAKRIHEHRQNVARWLKPLIRHGVVMPSGRWGFVGDDEYLAARINPPWWPPIVRAVIKAGKELEALYGDELP